MGRKKATVVISCEDEYGLFVYIFLLIVWVTDFQSEDVFHRDNFFSVSSMWYRFYT